VVEEFRELGADVDMDASSRQVCEVQPNLVRRAVRNVVENGVKYGGSARVSVRRDADNVLIEVRDHGPGMPAVELARATEPFHRAEGSRSRESGGTGLGLAIARAVAESHGGTLRLANAERGGLLVTLVLPAA
jgi:signal transduction histidine kinase